MFGFNGCRNIHLEGNKSIHFATIRLLLFFGITVRGPKASVDTCHVWKLLQSLTLQTARRGRDRSRQRAACCGCVRSNTGEKHWSHLPFSFLFFVQFMIKHVTSVCSYIRINYMWSIKNEQHRLQHIASLTFSIWEKPTKHHMFIGFFFFSLSAFSFSN